MTEGVTKKANKGPLLDLGLSTKAYMLANPHIDKLKCYGEGDSNIVEILWRQASKKSF